MKRSLEEVFRDNLKFYRQQAKISQEKLSLKLDKNINYINMIESGKSLPPIGMIEQIANELGLEEYKFFERDENERDYFNKNEFIENVTEKVAKQTKQILSEMLG